MHAIAQTMYGDVTVCASFFETDSMNGFENKILNFIKSEKMLERGDTVVVGFSGGADSTALMTALFQLRNHLGIRIISVHLNHGIRAEAGEDEEFAANYCKERGISFFAVKKDIPALSKKWNMTEEEAGRKARYEAFREAAEQAAGGSEVKGQTVKIAVAHHQDDEAETLLMNLTRGTGLRGAGGIRPVRDDIIRPLLCVTRKEIEEYLREKGISYCTDSTNAENIHTRNKIRNVVLPYLTENVNEAAAAHLCSAAEDFAEADDYIRRQAERLFEKVCSCDTPGSVAFSVSQLEEEPRILKGYLILRCFEHLVSGRKDITRAHVDAVLDLISDCNGHGSLSLPYGILARRNYSEFEMTIEDAHLADIPETGAETGIDLISLLNEKGGQKIIINLPGLGVAEIEILEYNGKTSYPNASYTKWFDYDRIQTAVFRRRLPEDVIILDNKDGLFSKKLGKYMTDEKIPPKKRDTMQILAEGNQIIWVPGYRIGSNYKVSSETKSILVINILSGGYNNG